MANVIPEIAMAVLATRGSTAYPAQDSSADDTLRMMKASTEDMRMMMPATGYFRTLEEVASNNAIAAGETNIAAMLARLDTVRAAIKDAQGLQVVPQQFQDIVEFKEEIWETAQDVGGKCNKLGRGL